MNKRETAVIYQRLCSREISKGEAVKEIEEFIGVMEKALMIDGGVKFTNIGTLKIVDLKPRRIAHPNTKEPMVITPPKDVRFKGALKTIKKK